MKNVIPFSITVLGSLMLAACGGGSSVGGGAAPPPDVTPPGTPPPVDGGQPSRVRFIAMGDSGTGSPQHYAVGRAMAEVCERKASLDEGALPGCEFVLGFGDNIYESGVTHVYDPQFEEKFELPFEPVDLPFYMVLGNHDNTGFIGGDGAGNARGEFQVDYHFRADRMTDRWQMPDRYYRFSWGENAQGEPLIEFFGLDSNQIAGGFADANFNYSYQRYGMQQLSWAKEGIRQSPATFRVAMGHHPYLSNGLHGNAGNYDGIPGALLPVLAGQRWRDFLEESICDQADFYMSGHDHDLQQLKPVARCGRTEFVVSGAAGKMRSLTDEARNPAYFQQGDVYGFFWMEATDAEPALGRPARLCTEAYIVDPEDETLLGVVAGGELAPAFSHCYDQQPLAGMQAPNRFSSVPFIGPALQELAGDSTGFDPAFSGPLQAFQSALTSGLNLAVTQLPDGPQQEAISALVGGLDVLFNSLDSMAALLGGDDEDAAEQSLLSVIEAANVLSGIDTAELPPPFDQLGTAFSLLADGVGGMDRESGSAREDLVLIAGPLLQLSRNIENILEGVGTQTAEVPVLAGITRVLGTVSQGAALALADVVNLDSSAGVATLIGHIQTVLDTVARDVLLLDMLSEEAGDTAVLPGQFLSAGLLSVAREVAFHLDQYALSPLGEILEFLSPVTNLLAGLLGRG
ncbi:MAG: metallophosphoesterase [Alcanivorax sp.]|nr:metallophosphoesterase [Alcanivorax sp.]